MVMCQQATGPAQEATRPAHLHSISVSTHQTRDIQPVLEKCWTSVEDGGPTLNQHWVNVLYFLGINCIPANMRHWPNVGLLLGHRLRRWPNSKPTLGKRLMFARYMSHQSTEKIRNKHDVGPMLCQHRIQWTNISPAFGQCAVLVHQNTAFIRNRHNVLPMLSQHPRRWPTINPALVIIE